MTASGITQDLLIAYQRAEYVVDSGGCEFILNVNKPSSQLESLHRRHGVECSAVITACNPFGHAVDAVSNRQANEALKRDLAATGCAIFPCTGRDPVSDWNEPGFLVLGLACDKARPLGTHYNQNAILCCGRDAIPQLVLLR